MYVPIKRGKPVETIHQQKLRHIEERRKLVLAINDLEVSRKDAAEMLGISLEGLASQIHREGIKWKVDARVNQRRAAQ